MHLEGARIKPSRDVQVGDRLEITAGESTLTVIVRALADRRGSATVAATLYDETAESAEKREREREQRRLAPPPGADMHGRPSGRDRRRLEAQRASQRRRG